MISTISSPEGRLVPSTGSFSRDQSAGLGSWGNVFSVRYGGAILRTLLLCLQTPCGLLIDYPLRRSVVLCRAVMLYYIFLRGTTPPIAAYT
ncbi:hypothetical protein LOK49_LG03G01312 [Camellia lanceoleosa]|uniref:Uncharacterized protein n=1 Tax=Camellia lanceoleosa TaxID=1840588 RepID=A0ACC0I6E7_9ERIC|nr:hypothetical protein LOK49_LG03G01312 [Camellia lanceoleosa]